MHQCFDDIMYIDKSHKTCAQHKFKTKLENDRCFIVEFCVYIYYKNQDRNEIRKLDKIC